MRSAFRALAALAIVSLHSLSSAHAAEQCPISKAHYTLSSDKRISISFVPVGKQEGWGSDVALRVDTMGEPSYWFMFDRGSARYINMISTTDVKAPQWAPPTGDAGPRPLGEMHYFAWSGKYDFNEEYPQADSKAPERIFLPDLAETMWYRARPRVDLKHGIFILDSCK